MKRKLLAVGIILLITITGFSSVITAHNNMMAPKSMSISQSENIFLNKANEILEKGNLTRHRLLLLFVEFTIRFRLYRSSVLSDLSMNWGRLPTIKHPLLFLRSYWLLATTAIWFGLWLDISEKMGWNWNLFYWYFHLPLYENRSLILMALSDSSNASLRIYH